MASTFNEENFSVCKVVWEYSEGYWDAPPNESPSQGLMRQLDSVSAIASQLMEEAGVDGFVYCSQTWSELSPVLPFTNSVVLVGMNPYSVGAVRNLNAQQDTNSLKKHRIDTKLCSISDILTGLNSETADLEYCLSDLMSVWDSQLYRIGKKVADAATLNHSGKPLQTDQGFMSWDQYQINFLENISCTNGFVRVTGVIRALYMDVANLDYRACGQFGIENHPVHGDMPFSAIEYLNSLTYFSEFINRLIGDDLN